MYSVEENKKPEEITIKIKNQSSQNEIDLVSSDQKIINNTETSSSIDNDKQQSISNDNLNKTLDNFNEKKSELIYGVPYENKFPKRIGNLKVFFYINNSPLIVIGQNSK